jgi:hypothetical protein
MNYFRGVGMFGSAFLGAHLMRGAAAAALLAWAIVHQTAHPWLSLGAGVAALVALRGCPMCWTVGLVETLSQGRRDSTIRQLLACVSRRLDVGAGAPRPMKMGTIASL